MFGPCLEHCWSMFGACLDHVRTMFGRCVGHILCIFGQSLDHVRTMFGPCLGHVWATIGPCLGHGLAMFLPCLDQRGLTYIQWYIACTSKYWDTAYVCMATYAEYLDVIVQCFYILGCLHCLLFPLVPTAAQRISCSTPEDDEAWHVLRIKGTAKVVCRDRKPCKTHDSERVRTRTHCKVQGTCAVARVRRA
jgi:hypothetical protein